MMWEGQITASVKPSLAQSGPLSRAPRTPLDASSTGYVGLAVIRLAPALIAVVSGSRRLHPGGVWICEFGSPDFDQKV